MNTDIEEKLIGDLKRTFLKQTAKEQQKVSFSITNIVGNIALAFHRGIAHGRKINVASTWISVKDMTPPNFDIVVACNIDDEWKCGATYEKIPGRRNKRWYNQYTNEEIIVTHWQPMPLFPWEEEGYVEKDKRFIKTDGGKKE